MRKLMLISWSTISAYLDHAWPRGKVWCYLSYCLVKARWERKRNVPEMTTERYGPSYAMWMACLQKEYRVNYRSRSPAGSTLFSATRGWIGLANRMDPGRGLIWRGPGPCLYILDSGVYQSTDIYSRELRFLFSIFIFQGKLYQGEIDMVWKMGVIQGTWFEHIEFRWWLLFNSPRLIRVPRIG